MTKAALVATGNRLDSLSGLLLPDHSSRSSGLNTNASAHTTNHGHWSTRGHVREGTWAGVATYMSVCGRLVASLLGGVQLVVVEVLASNNREK